MVGCVIARGAEIIGEGWHRPFGGDHAEVAALALAVAGPRRSLYVTLEPCCHQGKTPPAPARSWPPASAAWWPPCATPFRKSPGAAWPNFAGRRGRRRSRSARRQGPATQRPLSQAPGHRTAMGHGQMGDVARRQDRHAHRREPLDLRPAISPGGAPAPRPRGCDPDGAALASDGAHGTLVTFVP